MESLEALVLYKFINNSSINTDKLVWRKFLKQFRKVASRPGIFKKIPHSKDYRGTEIDIIRVSKHDKS